MNVKEKINIKEMIGVRNEEIQWNDRKKSQYKDDIYDLCTQVAYNKADMEPHILVKEISKLEQKINEKDEENKRLTAEIRTLQELAEWK